MVRVTITKQKENMIIKCDKCAGLWSPYLRRGGLIPRGYRKCPFCQSMLTRRAAEKQVREFIENVGGIFRRKG